MSKYFLPTAILLSIFIHVDILSMNEQGLSILDVIKKAEKKQRIEEQDKEFYDCIQKIKTDFCRRIMTSDDVGKMKITFRNTEKPPGQGLLHCGGRRYISVIKILGWSVLHLHISTCTIENLKDCKKIDDLRGDLFNLIKMFNKNHKNQRPLVYSYVDSEEIDKKMIRVLDEDENKIYRLAFLEMLVERTNRMEKNYKIPYDLCYKKQIHYIRTGIHPGGSDCAHWKTKKKRWSLPRKGERISDTAIFEWKRGRSHKKIEMCKKCESGIKEMFEENDTLSVRARKLIQTKRKELKKLIVEERNRILEQVK